MKQIRKMKLNTRLLAVFFAAVILLSLMHFFVYAKLLVNMEKEEYTINDHLLSSVTLKVDAVLAELRGQYLDLTGTEAFRNAAAVAPSDYRLTQMHAQASSSLNGSQFIGGWAVFFREGDKIVSSNGCYPLEMYSDSFFVNETYTAEFWLERINEKFSRRFFPEARFQNAGYNGASMDMDLVPLALKGYWDSDMMMVLFLDMEEICAEADRYLEEGTYVFSDTGELIYSADSSPVISNLPSDQKLSVGSSKLYALQKTSADNGLFYVRLLPESQVMSQVKANLQFCLIMALAALAVSVVLILSSVRRMMDPVNRMLSMLRQNTQPDAPYSVNGACEELEQILKSREQQETMLAQRDAALSEYFLQSRLKNVYVDMDRQQRECEGNAYILYIQVRYRKEACDSITLSRAELENCLQEMMSDTLNRLFDTTMVFQLEPERFAARVTVAQGHDGIYTQMRRFIERLENEQEFACFTVVQSEMLTSEDDLASVYSQVQEAARRAQVANCCQLLTLPLQESEALGFTFTRQEEKKLYAHVRAREIQEAGDFAQQILTDNLSRGISYGQMEVLCVAVVNTVAHAVTELAPSAEKIAAASGVYNVLTSKCTSAEDFREAVAGFIRAACSSDVQPVEDDPLLQKVQFYIRENYQKDFDGEQMAKDLWVSRNYLSTYYKSKTGMNLSDSIQLYRIQKAVELLKDPEIRIADLGALVGIPNNKTFYRQFKKHTGTTPREWRMENMGI